MAIYLILSALLLLANSWHVLRQWLINPPGTVFTGIAHYYADYFLYVGQIAHPGHLFTNENLAPTWIYWLYNGLGFFGGNPFVLYNASIIILSGILLWLLWKIAPQTIAFLFLATASNVSGFGDFWFSPTPALNRLGGVPHQIFQTILLLSVVLLFSKRNPKKLDIGYWILSIVAFLAATASPIQMLLLSIAICITKPRMIFYLIPAAVGALLINAEFTRQPILAAAKIWEDSQKVSVNPLQFLLALGPIAVLVPFGIKTYIKNISPIRKIIGFYGALSLLIFFSPIPGLLHTSPVRWISPASYMLFPLLAAEGIMVFQSKRLLFFLLIVAYSMFTVPSIIAQINARSGAPDALNHVPIDVVNHIQAIRKGGVVLVDPSLPYDVLIPVFTGLKTFTGHPIHTLYPAEKEALRQKFFKGEMTESEKMQFLADHNIGFILKK